MKGNRIERFFLTIVIVAAVCQPTVAVAGEVPWTSKNFSSFSQVVEYEYTAEGQQQVFYGEDYRFEPKYGTSFYAYENGSGGYSSSKSETSSTSMRVATTAYETIQSHELVSYAGSNFYGIYLGTSDLLKLSYSLMGNTIFEYTVYDKTSSEIIYQGQLKGEQTITVATPAGHEIEVSLALEARSDSCNSILSPYQCFGKEGLDKDRAVLNYALSLRHPAR